MSITIILSLTLKKETIHHLKTISPFLLVLPFLSTGLRFFFDIWRLRYIVEAMGEKISWKGAFYFTMGGLAIGAITPMQIGGIPFQIYVCKREGISIPEGSAAIFTRGFLSALILPILIPFIYYYRRYMSIGVMSALIKYLIWFYGITGLFFLLLLTQSPRIQRRFGNKVKGIVLFKEIFTNKFKKRKKSFFKAYLTTFLSLSFYFLTTPFIIKGMGLKTPFFEATIVQIVMTYAMNFMPTPGASGLAEGSAAAIFYPIVKPTSILGVFIVLWRFFNAYLGIIIGVLAISKFISEK
ncbi:MAG: lysylphosphatidylglycerol synthase transmembrane domain-containing protein [candidate division WOR-3 bacterium]